MQCVHDKRLGSGLSSQIAALAEILCNLQTGTQRPRTTETSGMVKTKALHKVPPVWILEQSRLQRSTQGLKILWKQISVLTYFHIKVVNYYRKLSMGCRQSPRFTQTRAPPSSAQHRWNLWEWVVKKLGRNFNANSFSNFKSHLGFAQHFRREKMALAYYISIYEQRKRKWMIRFQIHLGWPATEELEESQHETDSCGDAEHYQGCCYSSVPQADVNMKGPTDNSLLGFKASIETSSLPPACFGCVPETGYSPVRV